MGWTTLTLRKAELRHEHARYELRNLQISREKRKLARDLHYEQTCYKNLKNSELKEAKSEMDELRKSRPSSKDEGYTDWANKYNEVKEDYEAAKIDINDYYDGILEELEEESSEREADLEQEQTEVEAMMEDISQEIQAVSQGISSQIQSCAPKYS